MKLLPFLPGLFIAAASPLISAPLASPAGDWNADFRKAIAKARESGKDNLVVFTGLAWEPWSRKLHGETLVSAHFSRALGGDFVLTHIDLPETPKNPGALSELETQRYRLAGDFNLHIFPSLYVCTPDGYPYALVEYVPGGPEPLISAIRARRDAYVQAMKTIHDVHGPARALAIEAWLKTLPEPLSSLHRDKMEMIVASDPRNTTGLWFKYQMALRLPKARGFRYTGKLAEAEAAYLEIVNTVKPTGVALQDAYYELIDVYLQQKDYDKVLHTLDLAIAAAPQSGRMSILNEMTDVFTRRWIYAKYQPERMNAVGYDYKKMELPSDGDETLLKLIDEAKKVAPDSRRNRVLEKMAAELRGHGAHRAGT